MSLWKRAKAGIRRCWRDEGAYGVLMLALHRLTPPHIWPRVRRLEQERLRQESAYPAWLAAQLPDAAEREKQAQRRFRHSLSILIPTWNTQPALLQALADSLLAQTCPQWEACFYDGASTDRGTLDTLRALAARDSRLRVEFGKENLRISGNTNRALAMAANDWAALCDHDDLLTPDAVYHVLAAAEDGARMVYSDEDKCDMAGERFFDPHFKPDFAPDSLRSGNYVCHLMAMETALLREVGGLREAFDGSQDHDLALRASERAGRVAHIRRVLYHWRMVPTSFSHEKIEACVDAAARATDEQLRRLGLPGMARGWQMTVRVDYGLDPADRVSLISLPDRRGRRPALRRQMRGLGSFLGEVIAAGGGEAPEGVLRADSPDEAARMARGSVLLFLEGGLQTLERSRLTEMLMFMRRDDIACAGAPIVDRDRCYLHCGYACDTARGAVSRHAGRHLYHRTYQVSDRVVRNVSGVSACAMMIRRERFLALGGFGGYASDLRGLALGLRALEKGYLNVITPYALLQARHGCGCLTGAAPAEDIRLLREELPQASERYWLLPDLTGLPSKETEP